MDFSKGEYLKSIITELFPYNYSITGDESLKAQSSFNKYLDFKIYKFKSESELNGWVIPKGWDAIEAKIKFSNGKEYDCLKESPLGCAYLCPSYEGKVSHSELIDHLSWREDLPKAVVYDWTRLYRKGIEEWGLCIPWNKIKEFDKGDVEISIKTKTYESEMLVYEFYLEGESKDEFIINAHNCHPYQANDDISGCSVGISFFQYLSTLKDRRYSYRLLIGPELFAPMFWANQLSYKDSKKIKGCLLLKSIANNSKLKVQKSFFGNSYLDKVVGLAIKESIKNDISFYGFREYYGNDETVFESPGLEIPSITLTRYPFEEYHTNLDNLESLSLESLEETFNVLKNIFYILENDKFAFSNNKGLYCLSNPKYDLYKKSSEPGISDDGTTKLEKVWNLMMNCLPRLLSKGIYITDLSILYSVPFKDLLDYLKLWEAKGLAKLKKIEF
tara:strand:- start:3679 stop:5013 length:1335 start_codon:yes stop_codon:yes gene_type:complete